MRLLIVEDDHHLRSQLAGHFRALGWRVEEAADGREADYLAREYTFDLALVDLGLPQRSGMALVRDWRADGLTLPLLILTARSDWQDKVEGLEAGADDYVTKPFHLPELEARAHALLRRAAGRADDCATFGPLRIDFRGHSVSRDGQPVELTHSEFETLAYLAARAGEVVSRGELIDHLYDQDYDRDSNVIEVFVGRLRRKLDPDGSLKPIETVRGAGYRLAPGGER
ncbi:response regulator transcription factor [Parahaliea mediterranea]|uniref:response regulator transcription factor n=1 Tax=Parahaliea mediterranea TaxID=651086 RepID=UPI000E2E69AB|nr:response regulator transcription factor [Parahaliea mediterranea]